MWRKTVFKVVTCFVILIIICVISLSIYTKYIANNATTRSVFIEKVIVLNKSLQVIGDTTSSADGFQGYSYKVKGNCLYVKPGYYLGGVGNFDITLKEDMSKIDFVYLQGREANDYRLIWERVQ